MIIPNGVIVPFLADTMPQTPDIPTNDNFYNNELHRFQDDTFSHSASSCSNNNYHNQFYDNNFHSFLHDIPSFTIPNLFITYFISYQMSSHLESFYWSLSYLPFSWSSNFFLLQFLDSIFISIPLLTPRHLTIFLLLSMIFLPWLPKVIYYPYALLFTAPFLPQLTTNNN